MKLSKSSLLNYAAIAVLLLTLIGYPLVAAVSIILQIDNRLVSVLFRALVLLLSLIVIIKGFVLRDRFPSGPFWIVWWIFWGLYISRIIIDGFLNPEVLRLPLGEYLLFAMGMSLIPALALSIKFDGYILNRALIWIIVLGAIASVLNIWMITSNKELIAISDLTVGRQATDTLNPIGLANLGVTVVILSALMLVRAATHGLMQYALLIICLLIGAGVSLVGASRGPLLALALTLPMITYVGVKNLYGKHLFRLSVIIVGFLLASVWLLMNIETIDAFRRIHESLFSDDARMGLFDAGLELFLNNPILGAGTEPLGIYPHNVILESFMLSGIFSGFLFLTILIMSLVAAIKIFFAYPRNSWIALLYFQYLFGAMFSGCLYLSASMWALMVLVVSQLAILRTEKSVLNYKAAIHAVVNQQSSRKLSY